MHILIADDHTLFRDTVSDYIRRESGGTWRVTSCGRLDAAMEAASTTKFDLVLLDWRMPGMNGGEGLRQFHQAHRTTPCAVLSGVVEAQDVTSAMGDGAVGFLPKTLAAPEFISAISQLVEGKTFRVEVEDDGLMLTPREREVYGLLRAGLANKEIANRLNIALVTAKLHVRNILRKAKVQSRARLLARLA